MRVLFLLLLVIGIVAGLGYPFAMTHFSGQEIGSWQAFDRASGFRPVRVHLDAADAPVRVFVDMQPVRDFVPASGRTALTGVVTRAGRDVLVETLNYAGAQVTNRGSPQGPRVYRDTMGDIGTVESGDYLFTIGPGDHDGLEVARVDLVLRRGAVAVDKRILPAGIALIILSIAGLLWSRSRNRRAARQPEPPRWGRS